MLSHLWLKNRTIVSRWKIDYAKLNKHRFLARVQMSLHHCAKAAARGDEARLLGRGEGRVCFSPQPLSAVVPHQQREGFAMRVAGEVSMERPGTHRPCSHRAGAPGLGDLALYGALSETARRGSVPKVRR